MARAGGPGCCSAPVSRTRPMSRRRSASAASPAPPSSATRPRPSAIASSRAFKRGEIRALASMGVLTTGFNAPAVDLIAMLRPTKSAGLYVQMAGRGTRLAPGKDNCLVLDFAGNVARHGPVDAVTPQTRRARPRVRRANQGLPGLRQHPGGGGPPVPGLRTSVPAARGQGCRHRHARWRSCPSCGRSGSRCPASATAGTRSPASRHRLRVDYHCGLVRHSEWICFEHTGYAREKAIAWWHARSQAPVPAHHHGSAGDERCAANTHRDPGAPERPLHRDH